MELSFGGLMGYILLTSHYAVLRDKFKERKGKGERLAIIGSTSVSTAESSNRAISQKQ